MADTINTLNFTFVRRPAPKSGPSSSDAWNDSFSELANDLATISSEWNNKLVPALEGLPDGTLDTSVNVYRSGLDGRTIWVNSTAVSTDDDLTYFDQVRNRPTTIHESFQDVYTHIASQIDQVRDDIVDQATGLTTDQKNRIGANVFDNTQTSTSSSLDGKSENNRLNVIQLATDLYGPSYALGNDGQADLTNSVFAMVDALLELHNGNWSDDITVDHSGAFTATQNDINTSSPGDDGYSGSPSKLIDDLNQIRTQLKNAKGTGSWLSTLSSLYGGGASSLEGLLSSTSGSAAKSANNPWGYSYTDVDGLQTRLDAIRDFTGQDSHTDSTPTYSSTAYINSGDSLETAIGDLDNTINTIEPTLSGLIDTLSSQLTATRTFVGQDSELDTTPTFSSTVYVVNGDSLEKNISVLDEALSVQSGINLTANANLSNLETTVNQHVDDKNIRGDMFLLPGSGVATTLADYPNFAPLDGDWGSELLSGFTQSGLHLTYIGPPSGIYRATVTGNGQVDTVDDYYFRLSIDGVTLPKSEGRKYFEVVSQTDDFTSTALLQLSPGDKVRLEGAAATSGVNFTPGTVQVVITAG